MPTPSRSPRRRTPASRRARARTRPARAARRTAATGRMRFRRVAVSPRWRPMRRVAPTAAETAKLEAARGMDAHELEEQRVDEEHWAR